ncbi:MAG TPA: 3-methyladenine DNA glycosylase [Kiritimatiellia bacterium]|nr:3-methyladenine DNA glycosylase [Kiritimatiellia bacterium]HMP97456.1 3-methyladenine DNA glycosylase [Kiritimatiellia bacterium]
MQEVETQRDAGNTVLTETEWMPLREAHLARLKPVIDAHLQRASLGIKHPVMDFLFTYYPYSAAQLMRWTPGWGVTLTGNIPPELAALKEAETTEDGWTLRIERLPERRRKALDWISDFLETTANRPPRFGCFGLHEWAMVYRAPEVRHPQLPLRLSPGETARVVETLPVNCSHYDAFRFFTPDARPLNRLQPTRDGQIELDQPGCLHANMDLYKWAQQFYPWISSDLIADCFALAVAIREVDMRASPYDVTGYGLAPIPIETPTGREDYVAYQQEFTRRAQPLRQRLRDACNALRNAGTG